MSFLETAGAINERFYVVWFELEHLVIIQGCFVVLLQPFITHGSFEMRANLMGKQSNRFIELFECLTVLFLGKICRAQVGQAFGTSFGCVWFDYRQLLIVMHCLFVLAQFKVSGSALFQCLCI